jgi:transcription termination factor Rho
MSKMWHLRAKLGAWATERTSDLAKRKGGKERNSVTETDVIATPTSDAVAAASKRADTRRNAGLTGMVLTELRSLAGSLGIKGTSGMRKGDLIAAIQERQGAKAQASQPAQSTPAQAAAAAPAAPERDRNNRAQPAAADTTDAADGARVQSGEDGEQGGPRRRQRRSASRRTGAPEGARAGGSEDAEAGEQAEASTDARPDETGGRQDRRPQREQRRPAREGNGPAGAQESNAQPAAAPAADKPRADVDGERAATSEATAQQDSQSRAAARDRDGDDEESGRGRRGRRFRERRRGRERGGATDSGEPEIREDDVLQPVAGILDVLDNYAFVRTSGYLAGPSDVYVSMNMVRKNGLRRGDAITGAVRVPKETEQSNQRQKFNPLVRLDTINGVSPEQARKRPEFNKLTPLYPNQRLRLETAPNILTTRVIDLIMPIGKGQRALIVSPPKAGKTSVLQAVANAIATNNPECYLMVVLVDERPEEVTDMQRSVKGEVIASTFDRPPTDHTSVAELAIERAKRLVEIGRDVVVLLDSITRLGRAYNNSSPASGRILSGGVDSTALYPPKRFLGAARNIENGGSLTIIATAMVETGSTGDTVIFEEFKGNGNAELKLDRKIAERRVFPAVDVNPSGTRRDDLLLSPDEAAVVHKLRRVFSGLDSHQAIDLLIDRLRKTKNNMEFLMQVAKTTPGSPED